jgi:glycosyltransferase involved in cell wall biosynthesis
VRILMGIHHYLDPHAGASGSILEIGQRLADRGHEVDYYGFDQAFQGDGPPERKSQYLRYPLAVARHLSRVGQRYEVVDLSIADAWLARSALNRRSPRPALVGRSHGLEDLASDAEMEWLRRDGRRPSWRYRVYHRGYRLWELRRSFRAVDQAILLNATEREHAVSDLKIPAQRISVIPHGASSAYLAPHQLAPAEGPLHLVFVGNWIARKGVAVLPTVALGLHERGIDFRLQLLGTVRSAEEVLAAFDPRVRDHITVLPRFANDELPDLLAGRHVLLFPSNFEGFGKVLVEAAACGLALVSTRAGVAGELLDEGAGLQIDPYDAGGPTTMLARLSADRAQLHALRRRALAVAAHFTWDRAVDLTLDAYQAARRHAGLQVPWAPT